MAENQAIKPRSFNINESIWVRFSPGALKLWRAKAEKLQTAFSSMPHLFPLEPPLDANGYYRGQMWSIMQLVAPELGAGGSAFEGCLIWFDEPGMSDA